MAISQVAAEWFQEEKKEEREGSPTATESSSAVFASESSIHECFGTQREEGEEGEEGEGGDGGEGGEAE
jgi:hypothetical protein